MIHIRTFVALNGVCGAVLGSAPGMVNNLAGLVGRGDHSGEAVDDLLKKMEMTGLYKRPCNPETDWRH